MHGETSHEWRNAVQNNLLSKLSTLPDMSASEMRKLWKDLYKEDAPPFNRTYYLKHLAYRIQELAYGVDSRKLERRLEALAREHTDRDGRPKRKASMDRPVAGTRLMREYHGEEHTVTVLADGYDYKGKRYKSLSGIARTITGTPWSGPLFFGLRRNGGGA